MAQVVEHMPNKLGALSSNTNTGGEKKKKKVRPFFVNMIPVI